MATWKVREEMFNTQKAYRVYRLAHEDQADTETNRRGAGWYDTEADAEKIKDDLNSGKLTCSKYDPYYE